MNLEEIGKYRGEAEQHSVDVIRAAEERINRAKQQQKEGHGCDGGPEVAGPAGTEAKQWLADAASDARERCNPTASHGGTTTQSYASATAASRAKETTKAEQEGRGNVLTRQGEMGHGRQPDKVSEAEAVRAAVEKHDRGKKAGGQQQSAKARRRTRLAAPRPRTPVNVARRRRLSKPRSRPRARRWRRRPRR
jgi:hypothetical protein